MDRINRIERMDRINRIDRMDRIELHWKGCDKIGEDKVRKVEEMVSKVGCKHWIDIGQGRIGADRVDR